nr:MAG TPA: hypothetical protein [Caudoviricetes sp.]
MNGNLRFIPARPLYLVHPSSILARNSRIFDEPY